MAQSQVTKNLDRKYNLFPLTFPPDTKFSYQIWTVDPVPSTPKLREKIRSFLWQKSLKRPVFPHYQDKIFTFAVADWGTREVVEYTGDGEKRYMISPTDSYGSLNISTITTEEAEFAAAMLQQEINLHLGKNANLIRGYGNNQYFLPTPDKAYNPKPADHRRSFKSSGGIQVDIFRGFVFRVVYFEEFGFCLAIDVMTNYVGHLTLAEYAQRKEDPKNVESDNGLARWVNDYGTRKQSVYLIRLTERTIGETILKDGRSVFQYLLDSYPHLKPQISSTDLAASIAYKLDDRFNEEKHYSAAATLLKPKFNNASPEVRALHDTPAFPPNERAKRIDQIRRYFFGARFAGKAIHIENAAQSECLLFDMPTLVFKDQQELSLEPQENNSLEARTEWGKKKLEYLRTYGPLETKEFTNPFFVYPKSLEEDGLLDVFLKQTQSSCKQFGWCDFEPNLSFYQDDAHPRNILNKLKGIVDNQRGGFILLALPSDPNTASKVYTGVKTQIPVPSKCFSTAKLRQKAKHDLSTYTILNSLGILVENGTRLWGLGTPLNYEVQFGFDVARTKDSSLMGASVITGATASNIVFAYYELPKRDSHTRREGIPTKIIGKYILECLDQFFTQHQRLPRNILFQRDGRFYDEELKGIQTALQKLKQKHIKQTLPVWTAVEIQKSSSMKLRMFDTKNGSLVRPFSGSYFLQNDLTGHLITAGAPTLKHGTPNPLQIGLLASGDAEVGQINNVMQDVFHLSQLNWNSPEIDINLPITLRFTDQKLERYALELDDEEGDEDWDMDIQEEDFEEE